MNKESVIKCKITLSLDEKWDCYGDSSFFIVPKGTSTRL